MCVLWFRIQSARTYVFVYRASCLPNKNGGENWFLLLEKIIYTFCFHFLIDSCRRWLTDHTSYSDGQNINYHNLEKQWESILSSTWCSQHPALTLRIGTSILNMLYFIATWDNVSRCIKLCSFIHIAHIFTLHLHLFTQLKVEGNK